MLFFGLRRAAVVALNLDDYQPETGALFVKGSKGKDRTIYLTGGAKQALAAWLRWRGLEPEALLVRIRRWDTLTSSRMTTQAVYTILKQRAAQAGVADFSPHDFRRTFVGELLERGADIATVAKLARRAEQAESCRTAALSILVRGERAGSKTTLRYVYVHLFIDFAQGIGEADWSNRTVIDITNITK